MSLSRKEVNVSWPRATYEYPVSITTARITEGQGDNDGLWHGKFCEYIYIALWCVKLERMRDHCVEDETTIMHSQMSGRIYFLSHALNFTCRFEMFGCGYRGIVKPRLLYQTTVVRSELRTKRSTYVPNITRTQELWVVTERVKWATFSHSVRKTEAWTSGGH